MEHEEITREGFVKTRDAHVKVVYDAKRAKTDFPPWVGSDDRYYFDSEVEEVTPTTFDDDGFPASGS